MKYPNNQNSDLWDLYVLSAAVLCVNPRLVGGIVVKSFASDVRQTWLDIINEFLPSSSHIVKVPTNISDERLIGGLDLVATINSGNPVVQEGILSQANGGYLLLPMAERNTPLTIASICSALDSNQVVVEREGISKINQTEFSVIALDESDLNESLSPALTDRLSMHINLHELSTHDICPAYIEKSDVVSARTLLPKIKFEDNDREKISAIALSLGVHSIRACIYTQHVARIIAALHDHTEIDTSDLSLAIQLVISPRATMLPSNMQEEDEDEQEQPSDENEENMDDDSNDGDQSHEQNISPDDEIILEAAQAAIPSDLLNNLKSNKKISSINSGKSGTLQKSKHRGRAIGTRNGVPRGGEKLNILATLRASVPWQNIRKQAQYSALNNSVKIHSEDLRIQRFKHKTESVTIFVVDASGSSALHRLAEVKGAVELVLSECYVRRDQVALVAFRGTQAEILLPPTRSLVRAKRSLASLPGGGATPLAAGITSAAVLATQEMSRGIEPTIVLLTDGRANITLSGEQNRELAFEDALKCSRQIRAQNIKTLVVDTSPRPHENAQKLAKEMHAQYVPLPYADALALSNVIQHSTHKNTQAA